ncbi:MAG: hypothetical protein C0403_08045 [Desulfobacterium sp.]|nr:hypothetical protein [Desulfobacterium sp.]
MTTNKTITYQPATENKRIEAMVTREIKASPGKIYPLACPVEELRWIPNWEYELIYSKSGVNETNCIFNEEQSGPHFFEKPLTTTWVTVLHDPDKHRILFQLNLSGKAVINLKVEFREVGKEVSSCTWHMIFTALDEEANSMATETIQVKMELVMNFLSEALKHYCETGEMLK